MSEKSQKSTASVRPANSSEVLLASRGRRTFTAQFKEEALAMLSREGLSVAEAARRLGVHENLLRKWRGLVQSPGAQSPGWPGAALRHGGREPPAARGECAAADGAGDFKKSDGLLRQGVAMRFAIIQDHQAVWPITIQCEVLAVSRSRGVDFMPGEVVSRVRLTCGVRL